VRFVIKAVVAGSADASNADLFSSDAVLVDGLNPGSGATYDWNLLSQLPDSVHVILSGGLTAENVASGIEQVRPWGVDVSSGVEKIPGLKDAVKLRHFITNARDAALG
jgi:phosphoribosylanthranilate isomerase